MSGKDLHLETTDKSKTDPTSSRPWSLALPASGWEPKVPAQDGPLTALPPGVAKLTSQRAFVLLLYMDESTNKYRTLWLLDRCRMTAALPSRPCLFPITSESRRSCKNPYTQPFATSFEPCSYECLCLVHYPCFLYMSQDLFPLLCRRTLGSFRLIPGACPALGLLGHVDGCFSGILACGGVSGSQGEHVSSPLGVAKWLPLMPQHTWGSRPFPRSRWRSEESQSPRHRRGVGGSSQGLAQVGAGAAPPGRAGSLAHRSGGG